MLSNEEEMQYLATNLRLAMQDRKWNQTDLERASGVPQYTISRILRCACDPSISAVSRLAKALCVKLDNLLAAPPKKKMRSAS